MSRDGGEGVKLGVHLAPERVTLALVDETGEITVRAWEFPGAVTWRDLVHAYETALDRACADPTVIAPAMIGSATFDVGDILTLPPDLAVHVARIAPRAPVEPSHEPHLNYHGIRVLASHITGGHAARGQALAPLDEAALIRLAADVAPGDDVVVCAMGSLVSPAHETRAAQLLHEHAQPRQVMSSHSFFSDDITAREYTAVMNCVLQHHAEQLAIALQTVTASRMPGTRLYAATNEGGCVPLTRLSVTPIHMWFSSTASRFLGAATLLDIDDGLFAIEEDDVIAMAERVEGFFSVVPYRVDHDGVRIATSCVHTSVVDAATVDDDVVRMRIDGTDPLRSADALTALGAAVTPLSDISTRTINLADGITERKAITDMEARVRARLIAFGASAESIRVVESRSITSTYSNPDIISVRVRAAESFIARGEHAPHRA